MSTCLDPIFKVFCEGEKSRICGILFLEKINELAALFSFCT